MSRGQKESPEEVQLRAMQAAVLQARQAAQQMQLNLAGGGAVVTSPLVLSEVQDVNEALQVRRMRTGQVWAV
jgi:hypothetical protein